MPFPQIFTEMSETHPIDNLIEVVKDSEDIVEVRTYRISQGLEEYIHHRLETMLMNSPRPTLLPMVYTVIKELSINACKANQKRVFFEEKNLDISKTSDYSKGIVLYKSSFSESMGAEYGQKCRDKGYYCLIRMEKNPNGVLLSVTNNTPIAKEEEASIREKLAKAMSYDDLAQFYMDNADNTEGAGLGLALIIIMMKGEDLDPNYFRISIANGLTTARLEVPLTSEFKSKRD